MQRRLCRSNNGEVDWLRVRQDYWNDACVEWPRRLVRATIESLVNQRARYIAKENVFKAKIRREDI